MKFLESIIILIFFCFAVQLYGQVETQYSDSTLIKFVQIYMESKNKSDFRSNPNPITSLQQKHNISDDDLKVLMIKDKLDEEGNLTESQKSFIIAVQKEKQILDRQSQNEILKLCSVQGLDPKLYHGILSSYQNSTVFQNGIYPFFQAYFKTQEK